MYVHVSNTEGYFNRHPHLIQKFKLTAPYVGYFPVVCRDFQNLKELTINSFSPTLRHDKEFYKTYKGCSNLKKLSSLKMINMTPQDILYMCVAFGQQLRELTVENET